MARRAFFSELESVSNRAEISRSRGANASARHLRRPVRLYLPLRTARAARTRSAHRLRELARPRRARRLVERPLAGTRRGYLGGAQRSPAVHVLAADVLGRARPRHPHRGPASAPRRSTWCACLGVWSRPADRPILGPWYTRYWRSRWTTYADGQSWTVAARLLRFQALSFTAAIVVWLAGPRDRSSQDTEATPPANDRPGGPDRSPAGMRCRSLVVAKPCPTRWRCGGPRSWGQPRSHRW
jgi:hypothetical protein